MASVSKEFGPPDAVGTAKFCEMMDKFFDCFNVRSSSQGTKTGKAFLLPYEDVNDKRLSWLTDEFLHYLFERKRSIKDRPGSFDGNARARMFLSHQTFEGMKISIYSMMALIKFLLGAEVKFVLTNH